MVGSPALANTGLEDRHVADAPVRASPRRTIAFVVAFPSSGAGERREPDVAKPIVRLRLASHRKHSPEERRWANKRRRVWPYDLGHQTGAALGLDDRVLKTNVPHLIWWPLMRALVCRR